MITPTEDRGPAVLAVTAAMISCSTVFVFFRLASRIGIVKRVMLDDYFIIVAWMIAFGLSFAICDGTKYGLGRHERDITPSDRATLNRLNYTFTALYNPALMATKTSILVFFLTLAKQQQIFTWTVWGTLFVVNAAGFALSMVNIFQCRPLDVIFKEVHPPGAHCTDIVTLYLSSAPVNIITDIIILLLPMPVLKSMHLPRKQKWILYITFGFGIFVGVVDVVRISYLQNAAVTRAQGVIDGQGSGNTMAQNRNSDFSWYVAYSFMWSAVEVNVGIMIACVPALKPLVSRFVPQLIRDKVGSGTDRQVSNHTMDTADMAAAHRVPSFIEPPDAGHLRDREAHNAESEREMGLQDCLNSTQTSTMPQRLERTETARTDFSAMTRRGTTATNFDFVSMSETKGIVYMTNRESVRPIAEVTLLFVLWGFAYGLLGGLNAQIQKVARESANQAIGTHSAYYVGYFAAPLTFGRIILKRWGFKACYITGLMVYGTGTLIFWPAAVLTSWPAFLVTNFIIGMGLSTLEMSANAFIALCGPSEYMEARLQFSQGFQACGTVVATVLAKKALFADVLDAPSLIDVQWTYLAISLFTFVLAFVYFVLKVPEVTDAELEDAAEEDHDNLPQLRSSKTVWITLGLAALSQFCYVGGQESVATSVDTYINVVQPGADAVNYEAVGQTLFAVSRFLSAGLGFWTIPRVHLAFCFAGAIIFSALSMQFSGLTAGSMVMCIYFFEGPLFALIYAIPLRAMGKYTRDSTAIIAASISGGSFFPALMHVASVDSGRGVQYSFCVALAAFALGAIFPIYANLWPLARQQTDPRKQPPRLHEMPNRTLSSISRHVEAAAKRKRRSDPSTMDEKSSRGSQESDTGVSERPVSQEPNTALDGNTTGIDVNAFNQAPVCSSGLANVTEARRPSTRPASDAPPGTPVVTDFGAVDFGKYGRPSSPRR